MILAEKKSRKKLKRFAIIFFFNIILFIVLVIAFVSPIAKYVVEKYDVKFTGREIKMDWAYVNPFTGYVQLSNLTIYEQQSDSVFLLSKDVNATFALSKMLHRTIQLNSLTLENPHGTIIKNDSTINLTDIIQLFSLPKNAKKKRNPIHFNLLNLSIENGTFAYAESMTKVNYVIAKVNITSPGIWWDRDTIDFKIAFVPATGGGDISGNFMINQKTLDYKYDLIAHKLDLNIIDQYLKELSNYGNFSANVDANISAIGNFKSAQRVAIKGNAAINEFHFGKNAKEDYASFKKISVGIVDLNPEKHKYDFDSVLLSKPHFKYELYDSLDNFQLMFGKKGSVVKAVNSSPQRFNLIIEIAKYVKEVFKNFLKSDYTINRLAVENGNVLFNDYSQNEKFSISLNPLTLSADSVDNKKERVRVKLESGIKPFGKSAVSVSMNPKNNKDFEMEYTLQKIPVAQFNPYLIKYTSFPLDRGTVELHGNWIVRNDVIKSTNHFILIDPRIAKKIKNKEDNWLPMPLIMAVIRERGNVIDYEIPITGDLKNPKFHLKDALIDALKNIFIKPPTTAYGLKISKTENEIEKLHFIQWPMRQAMLNNAQGAYIKKIATFLKENPEEHIDLSPFIYTDKEKEYILFFEAKKKYYLKNKHITKETLTERDSVEIEKMSVKDSLFIKELNVLFKNDTIPLFTIQQKCERYVQASLVNKKMEQLQNEREQEFISYFKKNQTEKQVKWNKSQTSIPYSGFSYFKIDYSGNMPESIMKAYKKLMEIDNESPRNAYKKYRK